jgi:NADPH-dependent F420 reductase
MSTIGIIGGTGPQGKGLGYRFARDGHDVVLGSRSHGRAQEAADEIAERGDSLLIRGTDNAKAAEIADIAVLAVPYRGHDELVTELASVLARKTVVSCVNPLGFDAKGPFGLDLGPTSAAESAQRLLPESHVVGAFHHLSAVTLLSDAELLAHEDVLICGDDIGSKRAIMELAKSVTGKSGIDAGALRLARHLEPLTAVLISINKEYRVRAGIAVAMVH